MALHGGGEGGGPPPSPAPAPAPSAHDLVLSASRDDLFLFALALTGDPSLADDLTQDAALRALEMQARGKRSPPTFNFVRGLVRMALRALRRDDSERRDAERTHCPTPPVRPLDALIHAEQRCFLEQALERLPIAQRRALTAVDLAGTTPYFAARDLPCSATALEAARQTGLSRLRRVLRHANPDAACFLASESLQVRRQIAERDAR